MGNGNLCVNLKDIITDIQDPLNTENSNNISTSNNKNIKNI